MPRKASEQGACKDLEGHIFTIDSGNKGKNGDMLRTSKEKMATYIGTKYGGMQLRNGQARNARSFPSQPTPKIFWIGMLRGCKRQGIESTLNSAVSNRKV
jgi:hypothetical protein